MREGGCCFSSSFGATDAGRAFFSLGWAGGVRLHTPTPAILPLHRTPTMIRRHAR